MNLAGSATEWAEPIEFFRYPPVAGAAEESLGCDFPEVQDVALNGSGLRSPGVSGTAEGETGYEKRLAEETVRCFEAGRERGRQEGRQAEREAHAAAQAAAEQRRVHQAAEWIASLAQERDRYLQAVEHEVVKLALAVAARILRREAQMDPLLLTGAVRVALGQLSASTQVRLRVPPAELSLWTEAVQLFPHMTVKAQVVPGEGMRLGECILETELGSADLGIRSQLGEIERGFFDRPGSMPIQSSESTRPAPEEVAR